MPESGRPRLAVIAGARLPRQARPEETTRLIWVLGLGALGLAWSITTVAAYLPPILGTFTDSATLARAQHLQPRPLHLRLPAVVGRVVDTHRPASGTHTDLARQREEAQAKAEEDVIIRHEAHLHEVWRLS